MYQAGWIIPCGLHILHCIAGIIIKRGGLP